MASQTFTVTQQELDQLVENKTNEIRDLKVLKLEVINLALRCPGVTSGNLFKTVNEIMDFLKSE